MSIRPVSSERISLAQLKFPSAGIYVTTTTMLLNSRDSKARHMVRRSTTRFLVLRCIYFAFLCDAVAPVEMGKLLISPGDDIYVLAGTTASLEWSHKLGEEAAIEWDFYNSAGLYEKLMSYRSGEFYKHRLIDRHRYGYIKSAGSAHFYLRSVSEYDAGKYIVRISPKEATGAVENSTVTLHVIQPSQIRVRVTIHGIPAEITAANGTNVELPDDRTVFTPNMDIKFEMLRPMPWQASICNAPNDIACSWQLSSIRVIKRARGRKEMVIELNFNIQNYDRIRITKPMYPPAQWKTTPGHIKIIARTSAYLNWTHDIERPHIEWHFEGTREKPEMSYIMGFKDNQLYIPMNGHLYSRLGSEKFTGSAVLKIKHVHKGDQGRYKVKVVDLNSPTKYHISDVAELSVFEVSELHYRVGVGSVTYEISVGHNGTSVVLPDVHILEQSPLDIHVKIPNTSPEAAVIRMCHDHYGKCEAHPWIECYQTRYCKGIIPPSSIDEKTNTTIAIDYGIENLGTVVLQLPVTRKPGTLPTQNVADALMPWKFVWSTASILIIMFLLIPSS